MFPPELVRRAEALLDEMRARGLKLATAESCTGGLLAALLTEIPGSSDIFDRGFVTYSNVAKIEALGIAPEILNQYGAVSAQAAIAMATGALQHSRADMSVSVTGIAGPGGGTETKPVGLVHVAAANRAGRSLHIRCTFGDIGRSAVRIETVRTSLSFFNDFLKSNGNPAQDTGATGDP